MASSDHTSRLLTAVVVAAVVTVFCSTAFADGESRRDERLSFLDGYTLVVLEDGDISAMHEARELIISYGGRIAIMSPPNLMMGWVPVDRRDELIGQAGIKDIYYTDVLPGEIRVHNEPNQAMLNYYNAVVRGEIQAEYEAYQEDSAGPDRAARDDAARKPDVFDHPEFNEQEYIDNLRSVGLDVQSLKDGNLYPRGSSMATAGNSDAMTGTAAVSIFFMESDGSGTDPDLYTWTPEDMQTYLNGVNTALTWWSNRAVGHVGCAVTFLVYYYSGADPRCQQWVEPILHNTSTHEDIWVKEIMSNFGYTSGTRWSRVTAFNTWQRSTYETARAYSAFIGYNPYPAGGSFPDGHTAYAYRFGPYTVLLYNTGWLKSQTFAHESGHIFGACDEYASSGCGCGVCANGVTNENCENCASRVVLCMMNANDWSLCAFTPGQVGWEIVPCTPGPPPGLPAPAVTSLSPPEIYQGLSGTFTVTGSDFYDGAWVEFGSGVFVDRTTLVNSTTLEVDVTVLNSAPPGLYDVTVRNRDLKEATLASALDVLPTTRHYYSPLGADNFPYLTPTDAATDLEEAVAAGWSGDTLFVPSGTFTNFSIQIETGVLLHGAWNDDFTVRDLATGKTILQLIGNVSIFPTAQNGGLDGFIVENGIGSSIIDPFIGDIGGGVRILDADATIANCEFRNNEASDGTSLGAGGAIYAQNATVNFYNNYIHDNTGTWGGALYLYQCSGAVSGNTIIDNTVTASTTQPYGAGVYMVGCDGITLSGNTIESNTGAQDGGGVLVENSTGVSVDGGVITGNAASFLGGGVAARHSSIDFFGVDVDHNSSALGGGIGTSDTSLTTVTGCRISWNTGVIGGGVYAAFGEAYVRHNLFVGNSTTGAGTAVYASDLAAGEVVGNTIDRNAAGSGAGGLHVFNSAIDVFNNILANTTGHAVGMSGGTLPWVGYNLAWNFTGNDYDGGGAGDGGVSGDPEFADTALGDYHLGPHSPAIDAGRPGASFDDPDGSPGDMGWYGSHAFSMDQPTYSKNLAVSVEASNVVVSWDANPEGDVAQYYVYAGSASGFKPSVANLAATVAAPDTSVDLGTPGDSTYYLVGAVDTDGYASGYSNEGFSSPATGAEDQVVYRNRLYQNVPNPFNPTTKIRFELRADSRVSLTVYDVAGRVVKRLVAADKLRGVHKVTWDGTSDTGARVSSGIYFYQLETASYVHTRKMLLLK
jgi:parallel beta-helix repeat protein